MHARQCDLDHRPNQASRYLNAPALGALRQCACTPRRVDRICRDLGAPRTEISIRASSLALINPARPVIVGISRLTLRMNDARAGR